MAWLQSPFYQQLKDIIGDPGAVTFLHQGPRCILSLSDRYLLVILGQRCLKQFQASHENMTAGKNRDLSYHVPFFLLASETFTRNFQAEFLLGPIGQGWSQIHVTVKDRG